MGILRGMTSQISRMDVFAGLAISGGIAFKRLAVDAKNFSEEFEQSMREVLTISNALQQDFSGYSDLIVDMSRELPQSANALAKAYYQIVSAGYDGAGGLELLEKASRAAVGGVTDVTTAADGMTTVLNAWNLSAEQSAQVSDAFFTTVRLGKTTFGEMAINIAKVAPLASAYGVSLEEIFAATASITKQGTPTAEAMTQIRQALIALNEEFGQGWAEAYTFQEAMVEISNRAQASGKDLKEFTG
ncbi:MAG: phage tail tape measure protein, partial [Deltaproteobacteria bacterium]|nr:phage tail tape measure protein [Deltaproteobacteria bacterium]